MTPRLLYTTAELVESTGLSRDLIKREVVRGHLTATKISRLVRFRPEDIEMWLKSSRRVALPVPPPTSYRVRFGNVEAIALRDAARRAR